MAKETVTVSLRIEKELKEQAETLFNALGMNMTTALNIFMRQAVRQGKIPFEVSLNTPNTETLEAMQEVEDMISGRLPKYPQSVESLFEELEIDVD